MIRWLQRRINWTAIAAGSLAAAILHIGWTLAIPSLAHETPYSRLRGAVATNSMQLLPMARPGSQPMPFIAPDVRLALCPYVIPRGSQLDIAAQLPEPGWTLSLLDAEGSVFYSVAGQRTRRVDIKLSLIPPADRLFGFWFSNRGLSLDPSQLQSPTDYGLLVLTLKHCVKHSLRICDLRPQNLKRRAFDC